MLIRTTSLSGFYELVTSLNGNPETLLRRFNLVPEKIKNLEGAISLRTKICLMETVAQELDCTDFGLQLAETQDLKILGAVASVALSQNTVKAAIETVSQYLHYYAPGITAVLDSEGSDQFARLSLDLGHREIRQRQAMELTLCAAYNALKVIGGGSFALAKVQMRAQAPLKHRRYESVFGAPVEFGRESDALLFRLDQLHMPIMTDDPFLNRLAKEYRDNTLLDEPLSISYQVEKLIQRLLPTQVCNLDSIANHLGLHKRTLQRRLSDKSLVFEDILDRIRREQAEIYLAQPQTPMTRIATFLGYREQSSLNRACRRWFGCTPMERRRQLLGQIEMPAEA